MFFFYGKPCHRIKGLIEKLTNLVVHTGKVANDCAVLGNLRVIALIEHCVADDYASLVDEENFVNFLVLVLNQVVLHVAPWF